MPLVLVTILAIILALPAAVLGMECLLALLPVRRHRVPKATITDFRLAVVVPAHNEEDRVAATVRSIRQQLVDACEIVVVADNCTDATAVRARAAGAAVWERDDPTSRGKAYALNFAFRQLAASPPDVVAIVDADCEPGPNCLETIARLAFEYQQPVQAAYLMHAPPKADALSAVSAFAVYVKNVVRPRGLQRVGLPCLINGSGVAYPWKALASVAYPEHHLAEDYRFTTDLALAGYLPAPCMEVQVESMLPDCRAGFVSQRTRWEHGHILLSLVEPPRLLWAGLRWASPRVWALILEFIVPPLSLLVGVSSISLPIVAALSALVGSWIPLASYCGLAAIGVIGLILVWLREGRTHMPPRTALRIPAYLAMKAPLYLRFVTARQRTWERTARGAGAPLVAPNSPHYSRDAGRETPGSLK